MRDEYIKKFYKELSEALNEDYKIILEPGRELKEEWIEYDQVKWEIEEPLQDIVRNLSKDIKLSLEEKILKIYEFICLYYIYDDNVLFFFRRDESDPENIKYIAVDWYGRIIDDTWKENRKKHNRRICYEFSRLYAKTINELITDKDDMEAFMIGDKENTHYVVGLTGNKYSAILDQDDFNSIKDLTRLKLGLTLKGIRILRDDSGDLQKVVDEYNKDKLNDLLEVEKAKEQYRGKDTIKYFNSVVNILRSHNIDSQGFMEYMRSIIEGEEIEIEKIWKEIKGGYEKRYVRCLIFDFDSQTYLLDSVEQTLNIVNKDELDRNTFIFKPEENEYPYYGG